MCWQPIETYDGTYGVLLFAPGEIPFVGAKTGYGWVGLVDGSEYDADSQPTHWMPLPKPPEEEEDWRSEAIHLGI